MVKLKYNLEDISTAMVESGSYRARVTKVEQTLSKAKKPMLKWTWVILSGSEKGKEINSYTSLLENALQGLKMHLEAFGFKGKVSTDSAKLVGRFAVIVVGNSETENERTKIVSTFSSVIGVLPDNKKTKKLSKKEIDHGPEDDEDEDNDAPIDDWPDTSGDDDSDWDEEDDSEDEDDYVEETPTPKRKKSKVSKASAAKKKKKKKKSKKELPF